MQQVKNKDSKIEVLLRKELWSRGLRYRKNVNRIYGKPDIVFIGKKIAVFCDSLFWQTIPFLDLLYIDEPNRNRGFGTQMMHEWESLMETRGYKYVMTSTQADEDAWKFYEKLGYHKVGRFFPPEQEAEEWMYVKDLGK